MSVLYSIILNNLQCENPFGIKLIHMFRFQLHVKLASRYFQHESTDTSIFTFNAYFPSILTIHAEQQAPIMRSLYTLPATLK
jgi:hypothetical protein